MFGPKRSLVDILGYDPREPYPRPKMRPHCCPVCDGRGNVHDGFYSLPYLNASSTTGGTTSCRTCNGRGIVWEALGQ